MPKPGKLVGKLLRIGDQVAIRDNHQFLGTRIVEIRSTDSDGSDIYKTRLS